MATTPGPTSRLRFRPYRPEDLADVSEMFEDPHARRFYPEMGDRRHAQRWIQWNLDGYAAHGFGLWVIEHRLEGWFLGDCGLTYQPVAGDRWVELGYHLQARYRGNGYVSEAARACLGHAFGPLGIDRVCSVVDPENTASIRVASRIHDHSRALVRRGHPPRLLFWSVRPRP
ncbi:MAG: GNAT family N-acetyltransferase [Acidimicrobiia bacterium]